MTTHKFSVRSAHKMLKDLAAKEGKSLKLSSYNHHGCGVLTVVYDYDHGKGRRLHFATFSKFSVKVSILLGGERVEVPEMQRMFQESFANLPIAV